MADDQNVPQWNYDPNYEWKFSGSPVSQIGDMSQTSAQGDWWSQNAPPQTSQASDGSNPLRAGMSADEFRNALNQFAQSRGYGPVSDSSFNTWYGYYNDYGQKDPNYLWQRLSDTGEFGGKDTYGASNPQNQTSTFQADPGYQFRLNEGLNAINRGAAARGTLLTGGLQKGLQRYAQDYASNEFGNVFNRNLSLANLGQRSINDIGQYAGTYGSNAANAIYSQGNAASQGTVGNANAWIGTLGNLGQIGMQYPYGQNRRSYPNYDQNQYDYWASGQTGPYNPYA